MYLLFSITLRICLPVPAVQIFNKEKSSGHMYGRTAAKRDAAALTVDSTSIVFYPMRGQSDLHVNIQTTTRRRKQLQVVAVRFSRKCQSCCLPKLLGRSMRGFWRLEHSVLISLRSRKVLGILCIIVYSLQHSLFLMKLLIMCRSSRASSAQPWQV